MDKKDIKLSWKIGNIDLVSFAVDPVSDNKEIDPDKISFEFGVDIDVDAANEQIKVQLHVKIYSDETSTERLAAIDTLGYFLIKNFAEAADHYQGNKFPAKFLALLVGILISTTRGMLILLSSGTRCERAILPVINPMQFFDELKSQPAS